MIDTILVGLAVGFAVFCLAFLVTSALMPTIVYPLAVAIANAVEWCGDVVDDRLQRFYEWAASKREAPLTHSEVEMYSDIIVALWRKINDAETRAERAELAHRKAVEWNQQHVATIATLNAQIVTVRAVSEDIVKERDQTIATLRHQLRVEVERYGRLERLTNEALNTRDREIASLRSASSPVSQAFDGLLDSLGMNDAPKR